MKHFGILLALSVLVISCTGTPPTLATPAPSITAEAISSPSPSPAAPSAPTSRPVTALPLQDLLFQPGDLPDGFHPGKPVHKLDDFVRYKLGAADVDAFVRLVLQQSAE